MSRTRSGATVKLTVMEGEPLARLAEQRLRHEGIGCYVRSLGGGPGGWGNAAGLPHGLYVKASDEMQARQILGLLPLEIEERDDRQGPNPEVGKRSTTSILLTLSTAVILVSIILALYGQLAR